MLADITAGCVLPEAAPKPNLAFTNSGLYAKPPVEAGDRSAQIDPDALLERAAARGEVVAGLEEAKFLQANPGSIPQECQGRYLVFDAKRTGPHGQRLALGLWGVPGDLRIEEVNWWGYLPTFNCFLVTAAPAA